jgi:integrase
MYKSIRGRRVYFGYARDWQAALDKFQRQKDDLYAGRTPRDNGEGLIVRDLLNRFLTSKKDLLDNCEITPRTFADYFTTCEQIKGAFGLTRLVSDLAADDFEGLRRELARTRGPVALGNEVQRVRSVFKYGYDAGLVDRPVRFGPGFKRPSKKTLRKARHASGPKMYEAEEVRAIQDAAGQPLRTMLLLGLNCGFGNSDVGTLPLSAVDLDGGWIDFPRPKTGVPRRCPLWPETTEALREWLKQRREPKDQAHAGLVFITKFGTPWAKEKDTNPIAQATIKVLKLLGLHRRGMGFYWCRHTFATIGGESKDQPAIDHIMGHARDDMASVYRERISDSRLEAVTDYVHNWLFEKGEHAQESKNTWKIAEA